MSDVATFDPRKPVEPRCRRFRVEGRVQGVFFRASTRETARNLKLTGYARNMPDGSVEVLACGAEAALDELERWLWSGPSMAEVRKVEAAPEAPSIVPDSFTIA